MANSYFQFKQFTINQQHAALKVSTDSCLFGAWAAEEVRSRKYEVKNILDIGAGTGLLMLMVAQKCNAMIDGIEIDEPSYKQATENIEASVYSNRCNLFYGDVKQFQFKKKYDFIISNPPFYEGDLKSNAGNRNIAMHDEGLKLDELLQVVDANLTIDGTFAVMLPFYRLQEVIEKAASKNLNIRLQFNVKQKTKYNFFRVMLFMQRQNEMAIAKDISIKDVKENYTLEFTELLKDYYLYL